MKYIDQLINQNRPIIIEIEEDIGSETASKINLWAGDINILELFREKLSSNAIRLEIPIPLIEIEDVAEVLFSGENKISAMGIHSTNALLLKMPMLIKNGEEVTFLGVHPMGDQIEDDAYINGVKMTLPNPVTVNNETEIIISKMCPHSTFSIFIYIENKQK